MLWSPGALILLSRSPGAPHILGRSTGALNPLVTLTDGSSLLALSRVRGISCTSSTQGYQQLLLGIPTVSQDPSIHLCRSRETMWIKVSCQSLTVSQYPSIHLCRSRETMWSKVSCQSLTVSQYPSTYLCRSRETMWSKVSCQLKERTRSRNQGRSQNVQFNRFKCKWTCGSSGNFLEQTDDL